MTVPSGLLARLKGEPPPPPRTQTQPQPGAGLLSLLMTTQPQFLKKNVTAPDRSVGDQRLSCGTKGTQDEAFSNVFGLVPPLGWPQSLVQVQSTSEPHTFQARSPFQFGHTCGSATPLGSASASPGWLHPWAFTGNWWCSSFRF